MKRGVFVTCHALNRTWALSHETSHTHAVSRARAWHARFTNAESNGEEMATEQSDIDPGLLIRVWDALCSRGGTNK